MLWSSKRAAPRAGKIWLARFCATGVALRLSLLASLVLLAETAAAQPTPADRALATDLFQRGRKALLAQAYAEACPLLEESQRLDPAGGTLLNLALCHEQIGRTATAWSEFHDALSQSRRERREDRVQYAKQHLAALDARLSRLVIELSAGAAALPGLRVERDGSELGASAFGVAMPVDPGEHVLRVSAPGYQAQEQRVALGDLGDNQRVVIDPLVPIVVTAVAPEPPKAEPLPLASAPAAPTPTPRPIRRTHRSAIAAFALAAVSLALATGFGVSAIKLRDQAESHCQAGRCSERAFELNDRARRFADTSTALSVVTGISVAGGLFLWWRMDVP
jgi:serine/threonine-protein kinase